MTHWLNVEERAAWVRLASIVERLPAVLENQLRRDSDLTHFEYWVLAMLSEAPAHTKSMSDLAELTSATLPRLSHVVTKLGERGLLKRIPCSDDRRVTNVQLSAAGIRKVVAAAPGHVQNVRDHVIDAFSADDLSSWICLSDRILERIGPEAVIAAGRLSQTEE